MTDTGATGDLDSAIDAATDVPPPASEPTPPIPAPTLDSAITAAPPPPPPPPNPASPTGITDYDLSATRQNLAYRLLWIMIGVIAVFVLVALAYGVDCWHATGACTSQAQALNLITTSLSPIFTAMVGLVGLVGSVIGFYFGSSKSSNS